MSNATFILLALNLGYIGLLPRIFFRRDGRLNLKWWLTAGPFFLCLVLVVLQYLGVLRPWWYGPQLFAAMEAVGVVLCAASIAFISYTLGTHRRRLSLWHQQNDAPEEIVTYGAYRYVRHPFYASFIMTFVATTLVCLSPLILAISAFGVLMLNHTAAREEQRLQESKFGEQYRDYLGRSGRFLPRSRATQ